MQTRCEESRAQGWPWASDVTRALVCLIGGLLLAAPRLGAAVAGARRGHRPRLLSRQSVKEVAEIVGIAEATVKTRMFYARKKLAELVETT